jgi:hypothetical protein
MSLLRYVVFVHLRWKQYFIPTEQHETCIIYINHYFNNSRSFVFQTLTSICRARLTRNDMFSSRSTRFRNNVFMMSIRFVSRIEIMVSFLPRARCRVRYKKNTFEDDNRSAHFCRRLRDKVQWRWILYPTGNAGDAYSNFKNRAFHEALSVGAHAHEYEHLVRYSVQYDTEIERERERERKGKRSARETNVNSFDGMECYGCCSRVPVHAWQ